MESLPAELLHLVFGSVQLKTLLLLCQVSRRCRMAAMEVLAQLVGPVTFDDTTLRGTHLAPTSLFTRLLPRLENLRELEVGRDSTLGVLYATCMAPLLFHPPAPP
eukprot:m.176553 g.176553  ORF g.176553 m.176553 type:complete len:105 (+) comp24450_c0_seq2:227-541(+)